MAKLANDGNHVGPLLPDALRLLTARERILVASGVQETKLVQEADIHAFEVDGVVCLRHVFGSRWLKFARQGIEHNLGKPALFFRDQTPAGSRGRYVFSYWTWREVPAFRDFVLNSPAGEIAGRLMRATAAVMILDQWFLREAGTSGSAPWHMDEPYLDFEGRMCNVWIPLEPVRADDGLEFLKGSHRWGEVFAPVNFRTREVFEGVGPDYPAMPDIEAERSRYDFVTFELEPGDCLVFDVRTLHHASANARPPDRTIRRMTLLFADQETIFKPRGPWTRETSDYLVAQGQAIRAKVSCSLLPRVWER